MSWLAGTMMSVGALAQEAAILGYSPVSYFEKGVAERGLAEFAVAHDQVTYYLASEHQVELFERHPERYLPTFGAYCPYNLALGRRAAIDPENFKIIGGRLLLFHRSSEMDGREAWDHHGDDEDLLQKATREWVLVRF
ncbi:MAG: YHS domain-containing (seleno)protein [Pseudomonadales bacterium]